MSTKRILLKLALLSIAALAAWKFWPVKNSPVTASIAVPFVAKIVTPPMLVEKPTVEAPKAKPVAASGNAEPGQPAPEEEPKKSLNPVSKDYSTLDLGDVIFTLGVPQTFTTDTGQNIAMTAKANSDGKIVVSVDYEITTKNGSLTHIIMEPPLISGQHRSLKGAHNLPAIGFTPYLN